MSFVNHIFVRTAIIVTILFANIAFAKPAKIFHVPPALVAAAEQGDAQSQYELGIAYRNYYNQYLRSDEQRPFQIEAAKWIRKAADQGHAEAQRVLSRMYLFGEGVSRDYEKSDEWLIKAAQNGSSEAQYWLAQRYERFGETFKAIKWYLKSRDQGNIGARNKLSSLMKKIRDWTLIHGFFSAITVFIVVIFFKEGFKVAHAETEERIKDLRDNQRIATKALMIVITIWAFVSLGFAYLIGLAESFGNG